MGPDTSNFDNTEIYLCQERSTYTPALELILEFVALDGMLMRMVGGVQMSVPMTYTLDSLLECSAGSSLWLRLGLLS